MAAASRRWWEPHLQSRDGSATVFSSSRRSHKPHRGGRIVATGTGGPGRHNPWLGSAMRSRPGGSEEASPNTTTPSPSATKVGPAFRWPACSLSEWNGVGQMNWCHGPFLACNIAAGRVTYRKRRATTQSRIRNASQSSGATLTSKRARTRFRDRRSDTRAKQIKKTSGYASDP